MSPRKKKIKTTPLYDCKEIYQTFKRLFPSLKPVMWWKNSKPSTIRIRLESQDNDPFGAITIRYDILFTYINDTEWKIETVDWAAGEGNRYEVMKISK